MKIKNLYLLSSTIVAVLSSSIALGMEKGGEFEISETIPGYKSSFPPKEFFINHEENGSILKKKTAFILPKFKNQVLEDHAILKSKEIISKNKLEKLNLSQQSTDTEDSIEKQVKNIFKDGYCLAIEKAAHGLYRNTKDKNQVKYDLSQLYPDDLFLIESILSNIN